MLPSNRRRSDNAPPSSESEEPYSSVSPLPKREPAPKKAVREPTLLGVGEPLRPKKAVREATLLGVGETLDVYRPSPSAQSGALGGPDEATCEVTLTEMEVMPRTTRWDDAGDTDVMLPVVDSVRRNARMPRVWMVASGALILAAIAFSIWGGARSGQDVANQAPKNGTTQNLVAQPMEHADTSAASKASSPEPSAVDKPSESADRRAQLIAARKLRQKALAKRRRAQAAKAGTEATVTATPKKRPRKIQRPAAP